MGDKLKQSLYFPEDTLREIMREATRLDRSLSWTVQQAWRLARGEVRKFPSADRSAEAKPAAPEPAAAQRPSEPRARAEDAERHPSSQVREFLIGKFDRELTS